MNSTKAAVAVIGKIREVMSESLRCVFHGNANAGRARKGGPRRQKRPKSFEVSS